MPIRLTIADQINMPDGGPTEYSAGNRGFEIGRDSHLDWSLPDPDRVISSVHCRIAYDNGNYVLTDVSRNGTYVNGSTMRVRSPYRLADGDRLQIGQYIIDVSISGGPGGASQRAPEPVRQRDPGPANGDIWSLDEPATEPVDRRLFVDEQRGRRNMPRGDALDDYTDLPMPPRRTSDFEDESPFGGGGPAGRPNEAPRGRRGGYDDMSARGDDFSSYAPPRAPAPQRQRPGPQGQQDLFMVFCEAAGIPAEALQRRGSAEVAAELGAVFRLVTEQTIGLLRLRAAAKRMTKADRTMVGTSQNNALKLAPTPQEALTIMIGKTNPGYLDALSSFREGFEDIKSHEGATYAAMQAALVRLMEDFAPEKIEQKTGSGVLGSKKARAWEIYTEQWSSKQDSENGLLDVFLDYFRAAYDKAEKS